MAEQNGEAPGREAPLLADARAAYDAMVASKRAHFDFLQALERRCGEGGAPDAHEADHLAALLTRHDRCVKSFRTVVARLRSEDPELAAEFLSTLAAGRAGES